MKSPSRESKSVLYMMILILCQLGNDNITSSLMLTCDQAGGAGPGAGGQKGKKDRLIADYFVIGLSTGDQEI